MPTCTGLREDAGKLEGAWGEVITPEYKHGSWGDGWRPIFFKNIGDHVVPMMGRATEAVQCFLQKPIFIFGVSGVTNGRSNDGKFIIWKFCIAEGIFATSPVSIKLRIIGTPRVKEKRKKKEQKKKKRIMVSHL